MNTNGGVLFDLGDPSLVSTSLISCLVPSTPIADYLTFGSACTDLVTCNAVQNQEGAMSLSPFINNTLASTANAGAGSQTAIAALATSASSGTSTSTTDVPFVVKAPPETPGEHGDSINSIIIALPNISGLSFSGSSPATQTGSGCIDSTQSGCVVTIINQVRLNGNNGIGNPNCVKSINLSPPSVQCLQIYFDQFTAGEFVTFNLALNKDNTTISQQDLLQGTQYTVITSTANTAAAYATTTTFGPLGANGFSADSRRPDFTIPNQIDPNFVSASVVRLGPDLSKCTPPYTGSGPHQQCPGVSLPVGPD